MTENHDQFRDWAAAYVLGALDPVERIDYERHLRACAQCQTDVGEFAALPGLLAQVGPPGKPEDDPAKGRITQLAIARANHDYGRLSANMRRWRLAAVAAAAAVIVLIVAFGWTAVTNGGSNDDSERTELAFDAAATGTIAIDGRLWGTNIEVNLTGLPQRDAYQLWAVDESGTWIVAATWTSTPGGRAKVTGAAAVDVGAVTRVMITSTDREDVLVDAGP